MYRRWHSNAASSRSPFASCARSTGPARKCSHASNGPDAEESLRSEYGALRLRLEGELLRYIAEQSARAGSPQP